MKKLLMLAAAAAAILPMTAQANTTTANGPFPTANGSVALETKVEDTCAISELSNGSGAAGFSGRFIDNSGGLTEATSQPLVKFESGRLVDPTNARAKAVSHTVKLKAFCNYARHTVSLQSDNGGLTAASDSNPTASGIFHRRIAYNANISNWGGARAVLAPLDTLTGGTDLTSRTSSVKRGSTIVDLASHSDTANAAELTITTVASTVPLVQGDYNDVLRIRLGGSF